jgi:hypothetical protein
MDTLALEETPRWTVEPIVGRDPKLAGKRRKKTDAMVIIRHDLRCDGRRWESADTERGVERLREMARLYNVRGVAPYQVTRSGDIQLDFFPELL